jgi:Domain of unknown function (DUF305)
MAAQGVMAYSRRFLRKEATMRTPLAAAGGILFGCVVSLVSAQTSDQSPTEAAFLADTKAAMSRMTRDMAIKPSGDVDTDFVAMMIPLHQSAIDMAVAQLQYGKNEKLHEIAHQIIENQRRQIAAMRTALGKPVPNSAPPMPPGMKMK